MRLGENESELGEFGGLQLENFQIKPPPRAEMHRADAGDQHRDEHDNGEPINNECPSRHRAVVHQTKRRREAGTERVPHQLPEPKLVIDGQRHCRFAYHRRAIDERDADEHQAGQRGQLQFVHARLLCVVDDVKHRFSYQFPASVRAGVPRCCSIFKIVS